MSKTKKLIEMMEASHRRWCCWHAMALGQSIEWYNETVIPGIYLKGADKNFASMALTHFMSIYELNFDCANMIFETCKYDIVKMLNTLGDDAEKYMHMFTFSREKHPH